MQPEDQKEPKGPKPPAKEPEEPKPEQDHDIHRAFWQRNQATLLLLIILCGLWGTFFAFGGPISSNAYLAPVAIVSSAILVVIVTSQLISVSRSGSLVDIAIALFASFSSLVAAFSELYSDYGTTDNFTEHLTRLDAIYFTIGTLTTAGTGNISATSQIARGLQTLQMVLDIGFIVFAVSLVITEIYSRMDRRRDQHSN